MSFLKSVSRSSALVAVLASISGASLALAAPPSNALAYLSISPGFTRDPVAREISILDDGGVMAIATKLRTGEVTQTRLGTLEAGTLLALKKTVASIPADGKLMDSNEGGPICSDAPEYSYQVRPMKMLVEVARSAQCHEFMMNVGQIYGVKAILDGFNSLSQLETISN
ncbi:MAG: hypothetical protein H7222_01340 [Methylotenera sp.]|nr:hypothetical protein [Oligoflexia bacterium]